MTIACGMKCRDGVVLCADTEYDGYDFKTFGTKLFPAEFSWGSAIFSFSGPETVGKSTVNKCLRALRENNEIRDCDAAADVVENIVSLEYTKHVLASQNNQNDHSVIFGIHHKDESRTELYASSQTGVTRYLDHRCIGVGSALGHYLIDSQWTPSIDVYNALRVGVYTMTHVKGYIPGCGGRSEFLILGPSGEIVKDYPGLDIEGLEATIKAYAAQSSVFLNWLISIDRLDDDDFREALDLFVNLATGLRNKLMARRSQPPITVKIKPREKSGSQLTKRDPKAPLASRE